MNPMCLSQRTTLAEKLRGLKQAVAVAVTDEFFVRHPDWVARYGERGRKHGIDDACFHIDFLAGAVESGTHAPFEDYARWTVRMLSARQIPAHFVAENLGQVEQALGSKLAEPEQQFIGSFIRAGCEACSAASRPAAGPGEPTGLELCQSLFLQAILKGQRKAAVTIVAEAVREGHSVIDIYVDVFQESLYQVGRLWESNRITVAEEHMATAITRYVLAQTYTDLPASGSQRGNVVLTGVAGELHQVGANMVADILDAQGFDVHFLGTNVPHSGILDEIEKHHADVLGISATMLFNIPQVVQLVADVRTRFGRKSRVSYWADRHSAACPSSAPNWAQSASPPTYVPRCASCADRNAHQRLTDCGLTTILLPSVWGHAAFSTFQARGLARAPRSFNSGNLRRTSNSALILPIASACEARSGLAPCFVSQSATSSQRHSGEVTVTPETGIGKSPAPRRPLTSCRMLSRLREVRRAISAAVTKSSGSTRTTTKPARRTSRIADCTAFSNDPATRSKSRYVTPLRAPSVASSQPASNNASSTAELISGTSPRINVNEWASCLEAGDETGGDCPEFAMPRANWDCPLLPDGFFPTLLVRAPLDLT